MFALALGTVGAVCLAFGMLGQFSPESVAFAPLVRESMVSAALIIIGAIFLSIELGLVLAWVKRRSKVSNGR